MNKLPPRLMPIVDADLDALLQLNNLHAAETSLLDWPALARLVDGALLATTDPARQSLLIALDEAADYQSVNFQWFKARYSRFAYVDRIIVAAAARGGGLARAHYAALFSATASAGHSLVCCEVNIDPPNPLSDASHNRLGSAEVGRGSPAPGKLVRYLTRSVD